MFNNRERFNTLMDEQLRIIKQEKVNTISEQMCFAIWEQLTAPKVIRRIKQKLGDTTEVYLGLRFAVVRLFMLTFETIVKTYRPYRKSG